MEPNAMSGPAASTPRPRRPGLVTHYLRYSASSVVLMLAGLVSFPIVTRLLDNTQYGVFRYYEALMLAGVVLMKLGAQHSISRFYPYGDTGEGRAKSFGTTLVLAPMVLSLLLWILGTGGLALWSWWSGRALHPVAWLAVVMVPMLAASAIVQMVARAGERSDLVVATRVAGRLLELALVLGALVLVQRSATAVFAGKLVATLVLTAWLLAWLRANVPVARAALDPGAFRSAMAYGLPLMANEFAHQVMGTLDRVMLKELTGDFAAVGIYTIGYSLAILVSVFISATLWEAFTPVVVRTYETSGAPAVRALKARILLPLTYVVVAIVALLLVSGQDLLVALSGAGKAASGEVFVVVGIVLALFALFEVCSYGMLLKQRSLALLMMSVAGAALNVALNVLLVPRMGYMGSAWATAMTYGALAVAWFVACPKGLAQFPSPRTIVVSIACGALLVGIGLGSDLFGTVGAWSRLAVAGGLFAVLYVAPVLALDPRARDLVLALRAKAR